MRGSVSSRRGLLVMAAATAGSFAAVRRAVAGPEGGPGIAAVEDGFARIEQIAAFDLVGLLAVSLLAVVGQVWADLGFEERQVGGGNRFCRCGMADGHVGAAESGKADERGDHRKIDFQSSALGTTRSTFEQRISHDVQARMGFTTLPATSVSRKSRPLKR